MAPTQVRDELGQIVGTFHPTIKMSAEHRAELEELRKLPPERKLADVIAELKAN